MTVAQVLHTTSLLKVERVVNRMRTALAASESKPVCHCACADTAQTRRPAFPRPAHFTPTLTRKSSPRLAELVQGIGACDHERVQRRGTGRRSGGPVADLAEVHGRRAAARHAFVPRPARSSRARRVSLHAATDPERPARLRRRPRHDPSRRSPRDDERTQLGRARDEAPLARHRLLHQGARPLRVDQGGVALYRELRVRFSSLASPTHARGPLNLCPARTQCRQIVRVSPTGPERLLQRRGCATSSASLAPVAGLGAATATHAGAARRTGPTDDDAPARSVHPACVRLSLAGKRA